MKVLADLQLHSKFAMATSKNMDLEHLAQGGRTKGLDLLGTGDFTHPAWLSELKSKLKPVAGTGLFSYSGMTWMLSGEVSTVYHEGGGVKKVHHLLYAPDFDTVAQINAFLSRFADLSSDGRPTLSGIDSPSLVEGLMEVSRSIVVIPAHVWTPWFGVFGAKSGFESLEDCYKDMASRIFAIETGLSSDPPMNWRLSSLDRVALVSNSDAHSPNPWRLGREANAFDLARPTFRDLFDAVRMKDPGRFLFTVEVDPAYGKYHFTGHKRCGVSVSPEQAKRLGGRCPACGKAMTLGVLQRVEQLADRPEGYVLSGATPFKRLLPLYEVISVCTGVNRLYARSVLELQDRLLGAFGSEYSVLLDVQEPELAKVVPPKVARAIVASREGKVRVTPGYDGVYGVPETA